MCPYLSWIFILLFCGFSGWVFFPPSQQPPWNYRPEVDLGRKVIRANLLLEAEIIKLFQGLLCQRTYIPESGCLAEGHGRVPTSLQPASQWLTRFLHPLKTTAGSDKMMLMGSPTSNVGVWWGRWRRNKAESHSVSSWSSKKRGGREQPHEGARGSADTKRLCEETDSSSPNPVSSRVQTSFHVALLSLPSSL